MMMVWPPRGRHGEAVMRIALSNRIAVVAPGVFVAVVVLANAFPFALQLSRRCVKYLWPEYNDLLEPHVHLPFCALVFSASISIAIGAVMNMAMYALAVYTLRMLSGRQVSQRAQRVDQQLFALVFYFTLAEAVAIVFHLPLLLRACFAARHAEELGEGALQMWSRLGTLALAPCVAWMSLLGGGSLCAYCALVLWSILLLLLCHLLGANVPRTCYDGIAELVGLVRSQVALFVWRDELRSGRIRFTSRAPQGTAAEPLLPVADAD
eukprot:UN1393